MSDKEACDKGKGSKDQTDKSADEGKETQKCKDSKTGKENGSNVPKDKSPEGKGKDDGKNKSTGTVPKDNSSDKEKGKDDGKTSSTDKAQGSDAAKNKSSDQGKDKRRDSKAKKTWGKAITGVRITTGYLGQKRMKSAAEADPFLERFTVTGRAYSQEHDQQLVTLGDLFTFGFWREMVVDPSGATFYYWSTLVMMAVLYNIMIVIVRCVFEGVQSEEYYAVWFSLDYIADFLYCADMFVNSRIGFLEQGLLVRDTKRLTKRYVKSWKFIVDVFSIIPLDFLYLKWGVNAAFRLNRIFKTWRLFDFFHMAETHTNFPNLIRVSNLLLYIVILIHWDACIYFAISRSIGFGSDGWVYPDVNHPDYSSFWKQYLFSIYWSTLTLTTIGDTQMPELPIEILFCTCCSLLGVLIFATIFGNVGAMINHMNATRTEFQHKVDQVKGYMEVRGIGLELQSRVIKWFDYTWNNKQSIDDKHALEILPEKLRAEISIHVHMNTLRRVAIFQDCEPGLLVELVLKLRLQVFSPGDYICRKGDIGKEMYIVKQGRLQVVSEDGKVVFVTLSDGSVFGEVSILNIAGNKTGNRRTASVKSVGYSDLFCLSKNDLWQAIEEYPEAKKLLSERGKQILRKDNLLDEEAARREERRQQAMVTKIEMIVDTVDDINQSVGKLNDNLEKHLTPRPKSRTTVIPMSPVEEPEKNAAASGSSSSKHARPITPSTIPEEEEPND